jgi:hypothetical protein
MMLTTTGLALLLATTAGFADPPKPDKDKDKADVARDQLKAIDVALEKYLLANGTKPDQLQALTEGDKPLLKAEAIVDPWKNPYQYDASGPKNKGKKPDVWTTTPDKVVIGNWPEGKK